MFTSIDKALVAIIMGALYVLNGVFNIDLGIGQETVAGIIGAVTPILVWLVPNLGSS
jgi:hypothetical protein